MVSKLPVLQTLMESKENELQIPMKHMDKITPTGAFYSFFLPLAKCTPTTLQRFWARASRLERDKSTRLDLQPGLGALIESVVKSRAWRHI